MDTENITAISTAVIAFVTIIGLMFGFYYNLKLTGTSLLNIIILELVFLIAAWLFVIWVKRRGGV